MWRFFHHNAHRNPLLAGLLLVPGSQLAQNLVPAVVFDVKGICRTVKAKRHERTGKNTLFRCVEGTDLVIERVSLAQRVRIELDQFDAGIKKRDAGVGRNFMPLPIRSASRITKQMRTAICGGLDQVVGAQRARPEPDP